jgi:4-aminobutyrate aminotransferase-like enzyme/Ser/Thr protein kinase RdoA (MazF antagonist)
MPYPAGGCRSIIMPTLDHDKPSFSAEDGARAARHLYGLDVAAESLPGERDQNFLLTTAGGERFVMKISSAAEDLRVLDFQNQLLMRLDAEAPGLTLPHARCAPDGSAITSFQDDSGEAHPVRLLTWVPGRPLARVRPHTPELLRSLGTLLGTLDSALEGFDHPAAERDLGWDPRRTTWVREYLPYIDDPARRDLVDGLLGQADSALARLAPSLRTGIIHNDANDYNVIVDGVDPYARRVTAVVDFGDSLRTWTVNEVAVAAAYAMLDKPDPLRAAALVVEGYHAARPLGEPEIEAVFPLICTRLAVSVVNSAYQRRVEPGNEYLTISERPAWELLDRLAHINPRFAYYTFRGACGLEPCPAAPAVREWLRSQTAGFGPLLEPDPRASRRVVCDLGVGSADAGTPATWSDLARFSRDIRDRLTAAGAPVGVGRYDEVRGVYASDSFSKPGNDGPAWRTVHLGLDLFVDPGTAVRAPLAGVVHSVADNAAPLDYGPTVVLEHEAGEGGPHFFTLYGHLMRASVASLRAGDRVAAGNTIARVGTPEENGGWPPHLHFQVVTDLLDRQGDFPGVADPAERIVWLSLAPDPNLVAGFPEGITAPRAQRGDALLAARRDVIGPSLSVSYRRPLTIVRGWMQHLYDADGRAYLDAVNNVPHVGHCHPRVVDAGRRQMGLLNTNTRYLHESLIAYAEALCATLPEPLRACYFVNSGSEANELALRLARVFTGSRETIVVDVGYHGNTNALIEISPYKFNGPGGAGAPPHVHVVPTPDVYRGLYRAPDDDAGGRYAAHLADTVDRISRDGGRAGAFIAESILSCAGQIVLPPGYLKAAYAHVRAAGGVCLADEVQAGFGRAGTHFWAFETQGVVPDIVTMGKPIGNGHPLGAVVTTREIADAFANGMEYFNTYGGNPVSCAIGMAVLDVVRDEQLQSRALRVGTHLIGRLRSLMGTHPLIGDVRGMGLFIGIELVRDRETLEPAGIEAGLAANRMRDLGVLVSTDGPFHNVLKIKPPLCFTEDNADRLASALDEVLCEDCLQI